MLRLSKRHRDLGREVTRHQSNHSRSVCDSPLEKEEMFRGSFFLGFSYSATPRNRFRQDAPGQCLNSLPGSGSKESACSAGDSGSIPGSGRPPGEGNGNPLQYCCLENPHGQRSLAGYSPRDCKESDTTERLSTMSSKFIYIVARFRIAFLFKTE